MVRDSCGTAIARLMPVDTDRAFIDDLIRWCEKRIDERVIAELVINVNRGKVSVTSIRRPYVPTRS